MPSIGTHAIEAWEHYQACKNVEKQKQSEELRKRQVVEFQLALRNVLGSLVTESDFAAITRPELAWIDDLQIAPEWHEKEIIPGCVNLFIPCAVPHCTRAVAQVRVLSLVEIGAALATYQGALCPVCVAPQPKKEERINAG